MEKRNQFILSTIVFCLLALGACSTVKNNAGNYSFQTECLGSNLDGTQTVKAWGKGLNKKHAIEQAKKNALSEILFLGLRKGSKECEAKPILPEVNARAKNENYFNRFFEDGGSYSKFVIVNKKNIQEIKTHTGYTTGVTLKIKVTDLQQHLFDDNIIF